MDGVLENFCSREFSKFSSVNFFVPLSKEYTERIYRFCYHETAILNLLKLNSSKRWYLTYSDVVRNHQ